MPASIDTQQPSEWVNPYYVQISRQQAANILGRSCTELDRLRKNDPDCPKGFKNGKGQMSPVRFRLSDVYTYSELLIKRA